LKVLQDYIFIKKVKFQFQLIPTRKQISILKRLKKQLMQELFFQHGVRGTGAYYIQVGQ